VSLGLVLRVLQAVLDNRMGGIQSRILSLGPRLNREGFEIHVSAPSGGGNFLKLAEESGLIAHALGVRIPPSGARAACLFAADVPRTAMAMRELVTEESVDVVHVNGLLAFGPALGARLANLPLLWHLIGTHYPRPLIRLFMPAVKTIATEVAFVSKEIRDYYFAKKERCFIIPECVDTEKFRPSGQSAKDPARSFDYEEVRIGFLGNVTRAKGLEYLLQAIPLVVSRNPSCRFLIGGAWPASQKGYHERLRGLISALRLDDHIRILGPVHDSPKFYSELDVFCLPSISEGMPIVILEAMASGLPVVASAVGGVPSLVTHGVEGYLVAARDSRSLARAVTHVAASRTSRANMGLRGRLRAESEFSIETTRERYGMLYRGLAKSRNHASSGAYRLNETLGR